MEGLQLGVPFTFEMPIPADIQSSYRGALSYCTYMLEVGLDVPWAADVTAQTPLVIVR